MTTTSKNRHDPIPPSGPGRIVPPGPSPIDLHTHTTRSDGIVPPLELVRTAADTGVRLLSLTDHDTLAGYREVIAAGAALPPGLTLLPGVEINALVTRDIGLWEGELHILGFAMDPMDEPFEAVLAAQRGRRRERFERTVARLRELDLPIDDQVADIGTSDDALGRPTVARALIAAGHAASVEDAFGRLLSWGKPGYIPRTGLGPVEAIQAIRAAGGLPVLAHFAEAPSRVEVVRELAEAGLAGLEVYYRSFDSTTVFAMGEVARAFGLFATGGSDYHGDTSTYPEAHAALWVPPEVGDALLARIGPPWSTATAR